MVGFSVTEAVEGDTPTVLILPKAPDLTFDLFDEVTWKARRSGRRQHRRWAMAWSLEQIARRLPFDFPADDSMRISHEAIYQALYVQGPGALRMPRARVHGKGKSLVAPEIMISERPA